MKINHVYESLKKVKDLYNIDGIKDVIMSRDDMLLGYVDDINTKDPKLNVIYGSFNMIGYEDTLSLPFSKILSDFDYDNSYAKVAGKREYFTEIKEALFDISKEPNVTLPIINKTGRFWIRIYITNIDKHPDVKALYLNEVTKYLIGEEKLFIKTHRDSLTQVFNRYTLDFHYGKRAHLDGFHVLYIDLDNFKPINDIIGHENGNKFLKEFGQILLSKEDNYDRFYRVGGDEFVGLFFGEKKRILQIANEIINETKLITKDDNRFETTASIGIIKSTTGKDLIPKADKLMYQAKEKGKNQTIYKVEE
ncbi:MAG: GGDEF domain-containing protein [Candidatus Izimaplasma sp.]|nr:GGDEF domain-containing protein [Candidatus Izimaplasma bacterium]